MIGQQLVRQGAAVGVGCSGRAAKQRTDRERWLEGLAVAALTASGERHRAVKDAKRLPARYSGR